MDVNPGVVGERGGPRSSIWAAPQQPAGPWRSFLFTGLAWLVISVIVLQFALASVATVGALLGVAFLMAVIAVALAGGLLPAVLEAIAGSLLLNFYFIPPVHTFTITGASNAAVLGVFVAAAVVSLLAGHATRRAGQAARAAAECELLARAAASIVAGQEGLTAVLHPAREASGMPPAALLERGQHASGATGGLAASWTPVAISGQPPPGRPGDATLQVPVPGGLCLALTGRALPATSRSSLGGFAALTAAALNQRRLAAGAETAAPIAEADRMRAALLAAASHDLRTPLAAAKAAISGLRARDIQLTAADHDDLLATAHESLDLLTHLAASLLDMSWLQAGRYRYFPDRPISRRSSRARSATSGRRPRRS